MFPVKEIRLSDVAHLGTSMINLLGPEVDRNETIPVEQAGPDYVRVPTTEHEEVTMYGKTYTFMNRWSRIVN